MNEACNGKWGCVNRKLLGWAALAGTVILLYTAVRLSASCLTSSRLLKNYSSSTSQSW